MTPKDEGPRDARREESAEGPARASKPPLGEGEPLELEVERVPRDPMRGSVLRRGPRWVPFAVAMGIDALQWVLMPAFLAGAASPWNDVLDVLAAVILVRLLGWHWAFLPTFVVELIPVVDLVPTWTMAVWIATRRDTSR